MAGREDGGKNAASNLLADLSAMLQGTSLPADKAAQGGLGPASASASATSGAPASGGNAHEHVLASVPMAATHSPMMSSPLQTTPEVLRAAPAEQVNSRGGLLGQDQNSSEKVVAFALRALTQDFVQRVETMQETISKVEGRVQRIESIVEQNALTLGALNTTVTQKCSNLETTLKDVFRSVQILKDKQELFEAQQELVKAMEKATKEDAGKRKEKEDEASSSARVESPKAAEEPQPVPEKPAQAPQAPATSAPQYQQPQQAQQPQPAYISNSPHQQAMNQAPPATAIPIQFPAAPQPAAAPYSQGPPAVKPVLSPGSYGQAPMQPPLPAPVLPPPAPPPHQHQQHYGGAPQARPPPAREQSQVSSSRIPIEKVIEDVAAMGFSRGQVSEVVRRLTDNGQSVDLNIVLDQLMNAGQQPVNRPQGWYPR